MCIIQSWVSISLVFCMQVGGFKLPFLSVGSCVVILMIPCALLIRNISKLWFNLSLLIINYCVEFEGTKRKTLPLLLTLDFSTDFVFIVQGIRNFLPLWGHVISSAPLHCGVM